MAATNLLPGPASTQLAIYCAWRLRGAWGALVGGVSFIVPGPILIILLAILFLGSPPDWVRGIGAGAGAVVAAGRPRAMARARAAGLRPRRAALAARDTHAPLSGFAPWPLIVAVAGAGGLAALCWTAFKGGALSYGGGFVINGLPGALLASIVAFAPSFWFIALGAERFDRLRSHPTPRAFLDGAGFAAIGAIIGFRRTAHRRTERNVAIRHPHGRSRPAAAPAPRRRDDPPPRSRRRSVRGPARGITALLKGITHAHGCDPTALAARRETFENAPGWYTSRQATRASLRAGRASDAITSERATGQGLD